MTLEDRLKKLAGTIKALEERDRRIIAETDRIREVRRQAAVRLHRCCANFAGQLNRLAGAEAVTLAPPEFQPDSFREEASSNLFQLNVHGRILQLEFEPTEQAVSTEDFRTPYTIRGAIRSFNQELLDKNLIEEQLLFCCLERNGKVVWRYFDPRTYRSGVFDENYLAGLLESLLK